MRVEKLIAVIGSGEATPQEIKLAEAVGREIALNGAVLVCGGMGGVMEAACRGAVEKGGVTIGILPGDNIKMANPYVQIPIITGLGQARNVIVVKSARVVIAIGGSYGTLSEIGHALQSGLPVIGLHTWAPVKEGSRDDSILRVTDPKDAVELAISLIESKIGEDNVNN